MTHLLLPTAAPRLPDAAVDYDARAEDMFRRVLNLYFSQNDNVSKGLLGTAGGRFLQSPYGAFADYTTQTLASTTTIGTIQLGQTDFSNGISVVGGSALTVAYAGVYDLQFSVQLSNPTTAVDNVTIWLRQNGVDIVGSTGLTGVTPKHGTVNGLVIAGWNALVSMQAGDNIQLMWAVDNIALSIVTLPVGTSPVHPSTASVVATMTFVSAPLK